jgi:glycosyltransferase involved in cell wall biosynthesis
MKLQNEVGWKPEVTFDEGLEKVIEHWKNTPPLVSAIITTFNRAEYCREAMKSILAQTYTNFELIILDNSSSDNTAEVVKSFNDHRVRYIRHEPMNIAKARNLGWMSARGRYVGFLDDDDRWLPNKLEVQLGLFELPGREPALTYAGFVKIDKDGKKVGQFKPNLRGMILEDLLRQNNDFTGSASNPLIRRDVLEALGGYDEHVTTGEDWELYLRLAEKYTVECSEEPVLEIRQHPGPRLGDRLKEAAELELFVLDRYKDVFEKYPQRQSFYYQKIGGKFVRSGDRERGREYLASAIKSNRFNFTAYLQYLLSYLPEEQYRKVHALQQKYLKKLTAKLLA